MAFTDDFTTGTDQNLEARSGWSIVGGTEGLYIMRNLAAGDDIRSVGTGGGSGATAYVCTDQSSADKYAQGKLNALTAGVGDALLCCNLVDKSTAVGWRLAGTGSIGLRMSKLVSGTITDLTAGTSPSMQGVTGDTYKVEQSSDQYSLWYDAGSTGSFTQSGTDQTVITSEVSTSNTRAGYVNSAETTSFRTDDFEAGSLGGGGGSGQLMGSIAGTGGLAGIGGIAGARGGIAG